MWLILGIVIVLLIAMKTGGSLTSSYPASVQAVGKAIGKAEGFGVPGAIPTVYHNPGDITDATGAKIRYASDDDGWNALYDKITKDIVTGQSSIYSPDMTWREFGWMWVSGTAPGGNYNPSDHPDAWVLTVTGELGVSPDDRTGDYFSV